MVSKDRYRTLGLTELGREVARGHVQNLQIVRPSRPAIVPRRYRTDAYGLDAESIFERCAPRSGLRLDPDEYLARRLSRSHDE